MAWIPGVDTVDAKVLGNGNPISQYESKFYLTEDSTVANWNPEDAASTWKRLVGVSAFQADAPPSVIKFYDGFDELGSKKGRKESTFSITMEDRGDLQTVKRYEGQQLWYLEAVGDDRDLYTADGKFKYIFLKAYQAKLDSFSQDRSDILNITGEGSFNTQTAKTIYANITPVNVTVTSDGAATAGVVEQITVNGADFYSNSVDLSDLSAAVLVGEITNIQLTKVSGTPTMSVANNVGGDNIKDVTFTGTGTITLKAVITTKSAGSFESEDFVVTVS